MNHSTTISVMAVPRRLWPDICRVVSAFAVVFLHVTADRLVVDRRQGVESLVVLAIRTIPSFAVPCFFMLSGMLWLSHEKAAAPGVIVRRVLRLAAVWIAWNSFYALQPRPFSIGSFLAHFAHPPRHLWFLPAIVSCWLLSPGLRCLTRDWNVERFTLLSTFVLLFPPSMARSLYPSLTQFVPAESEIAALSVPVFYFLTGHFLARIPLEILCENRARISLAGVGCIVMTFILSVFGRIHNGELAAFVRPEHLFVAGYSIAVFLLFRSVGNGRTSPSWLRCISKLSFGIYLVHPLFILTIPCIACGPTMSILIKSLVVFACSAMTIMFLRFFRPLRFVT